MFYVTWDPSSFSANNRPANQSQLHRKVDCCLYSTALFVREVERDGLNEAEGLLEVKRIFLWLRPAPGECFAMAGQNDPAQIIGKPVLGLGCHCCFSHHPSMPWHRKLPATQLPQAQCGAVQCSAAQHRQRPSCPMPPKPSSTGWIQ